MEILLLIVCFLPMAAFGIMRKDYRNLQSK
jgi:hypothetical protein